MKNNILYKIYGCIYRSYSLTDYIMDLTPKPRCDKEWN